MKSEEYQQKAHQTAIYPEIFVGNNKSSYIYPAIGVSTEAGEMLEKIKKVIRDKDGMLSPDDILFIKKELGDVLWYVAELATQLHLDLGDIMVANLEKLQKRSKENLLHGEGGDR